MARERATRRLALSAAVGSTLAKLRADRGWTQDELAGRVPGWTRVTVTRLEAGGRALSADELLALALVFSVPVTHLLPAGDRYELQLDTGQVTRADTARALFSGEVPEALRRLPVMPAFYAPAGKQPQPAGTHTLAEVGARLTYQAEAVTKAARRLGVTPLQLEEAAYQRWTRGLVAERDHRLAERLPADATPRERQAQRGHVTRQLLAELREELEAK